MLTLLELKQYLQDNRVVGSQGLASQFDMPESLLVDMLERLMKKGLLIKRRPSTRCSSGCQQDCPVSETFVYEWVSKLTA